MNGSGLSCSRTSPSYTRWYRDKIVYSNSMADAHGVAHDAHLDVRENILSDRFPCLGAKAAVNRGNYAVGVYGAMCNKDATKELCDDIHSFFKCTQNSESLVKELFTTFVAVFTDATVNSELVFHDKLWEQLQLLHDVDKLTFGWDPRVAKDPGDTTFSYSLGGVAFFIVGMSPVSGRLSRKSTWPALVFNPGFQFEELRRLGLYEPMKRSIRSRDISLQGNINPTLSSFGEGLVALTYSSVPEVGPTRCPLHVE